MSSPLAGAEITTFLAPAVRCLAAASRSVKRPVLSSTSSTPKSFHGSFSGSLMADTLIGLPFTTIASPFASTLPPNRPCTESYLSRWASVFVSVMSFTATNSSADCFIRTAARSTLRPIRPNPPGGARRSLARVMPALARGWRPAGPGPEPGRVALRHRDARPRLGEGVGDARQRPVLEGVHRVARPGLEPHRRPHDAQCAGPVGAQPTWAEMRLGLAAAPAPGGPHAPPAVAADGAHHPTGAGVRQQGVAEGALRREEQLLDRVTRRVHGAPRPA